MNSPYFVLEGQKIDISITHSGGLALAIVGDYGLDLELIKQRDPSFINTAFSSSEIDEYNLQKGDETQLTMFWTLKEAHLKRMRIGIRINLQDVRIANVSIVDNNYILSEVLSPQGRSTCSSRISSNYVLSIADQ